MENEKELVAIKEINTPKPEQLPCDEIYEDIIDIIECELKREQEENDAVSPFFVLFAGFLHPTSPLGPSVPPASSTLSRKAS